MSWEEIQLFETADSVPEPQNDFKTPQSVPQGVLEAIWDHYVTTMWVKGRKPLLTPEREALIRRSVSRYGVADVKAAITGCAHSEWHMGGNPQGKKYNSIELILRNAQKIEFFLEFTVVEENEEDPF